MRVENKVFVIIYKSKIDHLEFLCLKPNPEPNRNTNYYVVTGAVESGETYEKAAFRETLEETGLTSNCIINLRNQIAYTDHITHKEYTEHCFAIKVGNESITLNEEHIGYKWAKAEEFINTIWWDENNLAKLHQMLDIVNDYEYKKF